MDLVAPRRTMVGRVGWLLLLGLLLPIVFHGCHAGGHDEDLLKVRALLR